MYTDILFDADDTLLDFQKAQLFSLKAVLRKYNIVFTSKLYSCYEEINHRLWGDFEAGIITKEVVQSERFSAFFKIVNINIDGYEANEYYQDSLGKQFWLTPFAKEVCEELSKKYTLSIVTNGVGPTQMQRIESSRIHPYIKNIIISENIGVAKPDKRFFDHTLSLIQKEPGNILLVGDSLYSDIKGANNANIDAAWYNPQKQSMSTNCHAKYIITDLRQLLSLI